MRYFEIKCVAFIPHILVTKLVSTLRGKNWNTLSVTSFHFGRSIKCFRKWIIVSYTSPITSAHLLPYHTEDYIASVIELSVKNIQNEFPVYYLSIRLNAFVLYWKEKNAWLRCGSKPPLSRAFIYFLLSPLFWYLSNMFLDRNFSFHQRVREMSHVTTINGSHTTKLKDTRYKNGKEEDNSKDKNNNINFYFHLVQILAYDYVTAPHRHRCVGSAFQAKNIPELHSL